VHGDGDGKYGDDGDGDGKYGDDGDGDGKYAVYTPSIPTPRDGNSREEYSPLP
jgi:hypothetical protein